MSSTQCGADVRNCTAKGILEIGSCSIWSRGGGWSRNVNKDCIKADASTFFLPLSQLVVFFNTYSKVSMWQHTFLRKLI